jgi:hypothetical protein
MRYLLRALLLALPLLAVPAKAQANGECACSIAKCFCAKFRSLAWPCCYTDWGGLGTCGPAGCGGGGGGCGGGCVGPWYTYWPYDNHFITPAHPEFPYWPQAMGPVIPGGNLNAPPHLPNTSYHNPGFGGGYGTGVYTPVSYPSYWYGR